MKNRLVLSLLLAFLLTFSTAKADDSEFIECYSDATDSGLETNGKECQVGFYFDLVDGCPRLNGSIRMSAPGLGFAQKKVMDESNKVELDRCRVDNNLVTCNCGTRHCNGNADIIRKLLAKAQDSWRLPEGCEITPIFDIWGTGPSVTCIDSSSSELVSSGDFCVVEVQVIPQTCFVTGTPVLTSRNITEAECTKKNTVTITCNTDNCNNDFEILQKLIEDGLAVSGGAHNPNCKKELIVSLGPALDTNNTELEPIIAITREPLETTTKYIPPKICTRNLTSPQYAMAFIIDGSWFTMEKTNNRSLRAILSFVENAVSLLNPKDRVYIEAYGGQEEGQRKNEMICKYVQSKNYEVTDVAKEIENIRNELETTYDSGIRDDTVITCGFSESKYSNTPFARSFFQNDTKATDRVTIHIGSGNITGAWDYEYTTAQIEKLKAQRVHLINIAPKWGNTEQMRAWSTNPNTDYFEVEDLDCKSLNLDLAKKILHAECN